MNIIGQFQSAVFRASIFAVAGMLMLPWAALGASKVEKATDDYLALVKGYADFMLAHGRDTYGSKSTPLFVNTLNLQTREMPPASDKTTEFLYRNLFRQSVCFSTASNPMMQVNLFQLLYALSEVTGDRKYRDAASAAIEYFFDNCQSPETGLMAWGEHIAWDLVNEKLAADMLGPKVLDTHEMWRPWIFWDETFRLAPQAAARFAMGLWRHQIGDHASGRFSRHAHYLKHGTGTGWEFPRHGGFYIATWAALHEKTQDPELVRAIDVLVSGFLGWRNPKTKLLPAVTDMPQSVNPISNLSLAIDLTEARNKVPKSVAAKMDELASSIDDTFLAVKHRLEPGGKGFGRDINADTFEIEAVKATVNSHRKEKAAWEKEGGRWYPYSTMFGSGYGGSGQTDAKHGLACLKRYEQTRREGYRRLAIQAAERYLAHAPVVSDDPKADKLTPESLEGPIEFMVAAYRLTQDGRYLARAEFFVSLARKHLFADGILVPLGCQRGTGPDYYIAGNRSDSLMLSIFELWLARSGTKLQRPLAWTDR